MKSHGYLLSGNTLKNKLQFSKVKQNTCFKQNQTFLKKLIIRAWEKQSNFVRCKIIEKFLNRNLIETLFD